ncbi:MAG: glucokinase [Gammaproteobacteria bacterium]
MNATLLMDIGGTNTRCKIIESIYSSGSIPQKTISLTRRIDTGEKLFNFINEILSEYQLRNQLATAVLCFAGPVTDHTRAFMTNWHGERNILSSELVACGLQADKTTLVNDLEAAAYGLLHCKYQTGTGKEDIIPLYTPDSPVAENGNALLIMPGTGTGISAILTDPAAGDASTPLILACETQHSPIPALDRWHRQLIEEVGKISGKSCPTWEDFVSGPGLEMIYQSLVRLNIEETGTPIRESCPGADMIAELAVTGTDALSHAALATYYRCAGALAQLLALTFRPQRGVYLAGNSTRSNLSYIPDSAFIPALHDNDFHREMLEAFPVYLAVSDLNLEGAAYLANRSVQSHSQISLFA